MRERGRSKAWPVSKRNECKALPGQVGPLSLSPSLPSGGAETIQTPYDVSWMLYERSLFRTCERTVHIALACCECPLGLGTSVDGFLTNCKGCVKLSMFSREWFGKVEISSKKQVEQVKALKQKCRKVMPSMEKWKSVAA